jgi:hypothetical protein
MVTPPSESFNGPPCPARRSWQRWAVPLPAAAAARNHELPSHCQARRRAGARGTVPVTAHLPVRHGPSHRVTESDSQSESPWHWQAGSPARGQRAAQPAGPAAGPGLEVLCNRGVAPAIQVSKGHRTQSVLGLSLHGVVAPRGRVRAWDSARHSRAIIGPYT